MSSGIKDLPVRFSRKQIINALRELPEKVRLVVFLVDIRQLGIEKTAEMMDRPIATVISETKRARVMVKQILLSNYQKSDHLRDQKMPV